MKKILLNIFILFITISVSAQINLLDEDGNIIANEQEFAFNTIGQNTAKLHFYIQNTSSESIKVKGEVVAISGTDGNNVQFCMGECLFNVHVGTVVPENGGIFVDPNTTTSDQGTYFWNLDDTNSPVSYKFKIYQIDNSGNQVGSAINVNYLYDENLSVSKNELTNTKIYPTVASSIININLKENATAEIFNLQGKLIQTLELNQSLSSIDISNFSSGIYLIKLQGESNHTITKKFIKK